MSGTTAPNVFWFSAASRCEGRAGSLGHRVEPPPPPRPSPARGEGEENTLRESSLSLTDSTSIARSTGYFLRSLSRPLAPSPLAGEGWGGGWPHAMRLRSGLGDSPHFIGAASIML